MVKVFFDCEFTGLTQKTTAISMGFVSQYNDFLYIESNSFDTNQVDDWIKDNVIDNLKYKEELFRDCSIETIYDYGYSKDNPLTSRTETSFGNKTYVEAKPNTGTLIANWLEEISNKYQYQIQIIGDCPHYDWVLFCELFGGALNLPKGISPACRNINQDIAYFFTTTDRDAFYVDRASFAEYEPTSKLNIPKIQPTKHNALWDALIIKRCYDKIFNT